MKSGILAYLTFISLFGITGCSTSEDNASEAKQTPVASEPKVQLPFRFHKEIEVKPGLTFDVVSWGRGSETSGGYIILRSDSTHLKYRTTTGELDGKLRDAWNMDMDSDGNPEIFLQAEGVGEGSHLNMYVYEFNDAGTGNKISFPSLSGSLKKGYKGQDSLYVRDGKLLREFPVFDDTDTTAKSSARKVLEYSFRNNRFLVEEVEQESKKD